MIRSNPRTLILRLRLSGLFEFACSYDHVSIIKSALTTTELDCHARIKYCFDMSASGFNNEYIWIERTDLKDGDFRVDLSGERSLSLYARFCAVKLLDFESSARADEILECYEQESGRLTLSGVLIQPPTGDSRSEWLAEFHSGDPEISDYSFTKCSL